MIIFKLILMAVGLSFIYVGMELVPSSFLGTFFGISGIVIIGSIFYIGYKMEKIRK